jgi:preprotein translocase subunit SecD
MRKLRALFVAAAMIFGVGQYATHAEEIAVSFVHAKGRVDVPVSALDRVQAYPTLKFRSSETGAVREFPDPHVEICVTKELKERICDLTKNVVGEATAVVVDCETVTKPIVREALCARSCFSVSANDLKEANALAQRIRRGSNRACATSF